MVMKTVEEREDEIVFKELDWLDRAMFATSVQPSGCFKQAWTMKLMRSGSHCQLPRGFLKGRKRPFFVGVRRRKLQYKSLGQQLVTDLRNDFGKKC